jgi:hypothetical protein
MVLYNKAGDFLGIDQDVLTLMGFEDMEDFKLHVADFADCFVPRAGYIYKFEKFFWIDYLLHGGVPSKKALLRLKSGKEIVVEVQINELFPLGKFENQEALYGVNLSRLKETPLPEEKVFIDA